MCWFSSRSVLAHGVMLPRCAAADAPCIAGGGAPGRHACAVAATPAHPCPRCVLHCSNTSIATCIIVFITHTSADTAPLAANPC